jgi:hypothetical protein
VQFARLEIRELKLNRDVLRDDEIDRAVVNNRVGRDFLEFRPRHIA